MKYLTVPPKVVIHDGETTNQGQDTQILFNKDIVEELLVSSGESFQYDGYTIVLDKYLYDEKTGNGYCEFKITNEAWEKNEGVEKGQERFDEYFGKFEIRHFYFKKH